MRALPIALAALILTAPCAWAAPERPVLVAEATLSPQVQMLVDAGKKALEAGQYEQAISNFQDADQAAPDTPAIKSLLAEAQQKAVAQYVAKGQADLAAKKYPEAGAAFDSALGILPDDETAKKGKARAEHGPHADAYVAAAKEKLAKGQIDVAVAYLEKAYALDGDPAIAKLLKSAKAKQKKAEE